MKFLFFFYRIKYELVASEGTAELDDEASKFDYSAFVEAAPVEANFADLALTLRSAANFTVGVRIITAAGHRSAFSEPQLIEIQPVPTIICSTSNYHYLNVGDCNQ